MAEDPAKLRQESNDAFRALVKAMAINTTSNANLNKLVNTATVAIRKVKRLPEVRASANVNNQPPAKNPSLFSRLTAEAASKLRNIKGIVSASRVASEATSVAKALAFAKKLARGIKRPARAPVNYNKIIASYNSYAKTNEQKKAAAQKMAHEYRVASKLAKNTLTRAGRTLSMFPRTVPMAGRYNSRQAFLNEMAGYNAIENAGAAIVNEETTVKQIANKLFTGSSITAPGGQMTRGTMWRRLGLEVGAPVNRAAVLGVLKTYRYFPTNKKSIMQINKASRINAQINYAKSLLNSLAPENNAPPVAGPAAAPTDKGIKLRMTNGSMVKAVQSRTGPNAGKFFAVRNNGLRKLTRNKRGMANYNKVNVGMYVNTPGGIFPKNYSQTIRIGPGEKPPAYTVLKSPSGEFFAVLPTGNMRKLKANKSNFNNSNLTFYKKNNKGNFAPSDLQKLANTYVRKLYAETGYGGLMGKGPEIKTNAQILANERFKLPTNLTRRRNITESALTTYFAASNRPRQFNAITKRLPRMKTILTAAHDALLKEAKNDIAAKTGILQTLINNKKRAETIANKNPRGNKDYETVRNYGEDLETAYENYTQVVNKWMNKLPNNNRRQLNAAKTAINSKVATRLATIEGIKSRMAKYRIITAVALRNNLPKLKNVILPAALEGLKNIPNGPNKINAASAIKKATKFVKKAEAEAEITKIINALKGKIPAAGTAVNGTQHANLRAALDKAKYNIRIAEGGTGADKKNQELATYTARINAFGNALSRAVRLAAVKNKINKLTIVSANNKTLREMLAEIGRVESEISTIRSAFSNLELGNKLNALNEKSVQLTALKAAAKLKAQAEYDTLKADLTAELKTHEAVLNNPKKSKEEAKVSAWAANAAVGKHADRLKNIVKAGVAVNSSEFNRRLAALRPKLENFNKFRITGTREPKPKWDAQANKYLSPNTYTENKEKINRQFKKGLIGWKNKDLTNFWKAVSSLKRKRGRVGGAGEAVENAGTSQTVPAAAPRGAALAAAAVATVP